MERMASNQVPPIVEFRADLPRTPSAKVIERELAVSAYRLSAWPWQLP